MVKAVKFAGRIFKLPLITTPKGELFVKVPFGNKRTVYSTAWRNSARFMINESSGNTEI